MSYVSREIYTRQCCCTFVQLSVVTVTLTDKLDVGREPNAQFPRQQKNNASTTIW